MTACSARTRPGAPKATIYLTPVENPTAYGLVKLDPDGRVQSFLEKPGWEEVTTNTVNAGVYVLEREFLEWIPKGEAYSMEREFFPLLLERGVPLLRLRLDGLLARHRHARQVLPGPAGPPGAPDPRARGAPRPRAARGLDPSDGHGSPPTARVRGPGGDRPRLPRSTRDVVMGPSVVLGAGLPRRSRGAHVDTSVLWETRLPGWRRRRDSRAVSLGRGVSVGDHARVTPGAVLADGTRLGDYSRLAGDR